MGVIHPGPNKFETGAQPPLRSIYPARQATGRPASNLWQLYKILARNSNRRFWGEQVCAISFGSPVRGRSGLAFCAIIGVSKLIVLPISSLSSRNYQPLCHVRCHGSVIFGRMSSTVRRQMTQNTPAAGVTLRSHTGRFTLHVSRLGIQKYSFQGECYGQTCTLVVISSLFIHAISHSAS